MAWELLLLFGYLTLICLKEIWVGLSSKIRVLSSGTLSKTTERKNLFRHIDRRDVLWTLLENGGRSERDKLHRRRSTKLTIPPSSDARPL